MRARAAVIVLVALLVAVGARVALGSPAAVADLRSVPLVRADARIDKTVTDTDVAELGHTIERSVAYVEDLFQHRFTQKPKIVLFGDTAAFGDGLAALFNYAESTVTLASSSYGGIFDRSTSTIAVNLETVGSASLPPTLDHEFTHYIAQELTHGRDLPAWFDEGLATIDERQPANSTRWLEEDALTARAIAASGRVSLAQLETLPGWHATYPQFGQSLYTYAAAATTAVKDRVGWRGVLDLLDAVGAGRSFAEAYQKASGETIATLEERVRNESSAKIISRRLPSGDVAWTLFSGKRLAEEKVSIGGSKSTYVVTFTVTTDDLGLYRGSFGSTSPPGTYLIYAAGAHVEITTGAR